MEIADLCLADPREDSYGTAPVKSYRERFAERDLTDRRQVYVGVHVPVRTSSLHNDSPGSNGKRMFKLPLRPFPKMHYQGGKKKRLDTSKNNGMQTDDESDLEAQAGLGSVPTPAVERVKFILGGDQDEDASENPELFTELDELFMYLDGNIEWKETARWYKYEEDVEEGGDRWTRPHVATLSLYSIFELRSSLMAGTVILDMDANNLLQIADLVIDSLISCNKLEEIFRAKVRDTLLRRHRHQRPTGSGLRRGLSSIIGKRSSQTAMAGAGSQVLNTGSQTFPCDARSDDANCSDVRVDQQSSLDEPAESGRSCSQPDLSAATTTLVDTPREKLVRNESVQGHLVYQQPRSPDAEEEAYEKAPAFMKKLPPNAEASNVLVGEVDYLDRPITAFVRLASSALLDEVTEIPVPTRFLFIMLGPVIAQGRYHEIGRAISTLMADEVFHDVAYKAKSRDDLIAGIDEFLEQVTVLPPGELDPSIRIEPPTAYKQSRRYNLDIKRQDSALDKPSAGSDACESSLGDSTCDYFTRTKLMLGGLRRDIDQRRTRHGDLKDAFNLQCVGSVFFMYFAILAVVYTTGRRQEASTGGLLGLREYVISFGFGGLIFVLCSGQPMTMLCSTLPIVFFEEMVYNMCSKFSLDFLPFRMWIGVWAVVLLLVFTTFDVSNYVGYATRFSVEIFMVVSAAAMFAHGCASVHHIRTVSSVMAGYFTNSSCQCLKELRVRRNISSVEEGNSSLPNSPLLSGVPAGLEVLNLVPLGVPFRDCVYRGGKLVGVGCNHDVYFLSLILTLFTLLTMLLILLFRKSGFLPNKLRYVIDDFITPVAVVVMSGVAASFDVNLNFVDMAATFPVNSAVGRNSWLVPALGKNEIWTILVAALPGAWLSLLLLVEQQTTGAVVNQRSNLLKKGFGYHLDLLAVSAGVMFSAVFGLPFLVGSAVLTVSNLQSLKITDPDTYKCTFSGVREQRLTGSLVCILLAASPMFMPVLRFLPVPVLHGIFLYCCVRSLHCVQFVERLLLLFMPRINRPEIVYLRQVPLISANVYSLVQVCCTLVLCAVRATQAAIIFPLLIFLLFVVRLLLEYLLPIHDVLILDEVMDKSCHLRVSKRRSSSKHLLLLQDAGKPLMLKDCADLPFEPKHVNGLVNISEELSKTSAWKQIAHADNSTNSPSSNSPKGAKECRKRRRKKSRPLERDKTSNLTRLKGAPRCESEGVETEPDESLCPENYDSMSDVNVPDQSFEVRDGSSFRERKQSRTKETGSKGSVKKQHDTSRRTRNGKSAAVPVSAPVPPWEQPYHSPPRTGFGLLKIPEDDISIDPGYARSTSDGASRSNSVEFLALPECDQVPAMDDSFFDQAPSRAFDDTIRLA